MVYEEIMHYLVEIEVMKSKYKFPSEVWFALTILAICKINNIDYNKFKEFITNNDKKEDDITKELTK
jgi:hypothetical protein